MIWLWVYTAVICITITVCIISGQTVLTHIRTSSEGTEKASENQHNNNNEEIETLCAVTSSLNLTGNISKTEGKIRATSMAK